jgi:YggT family protein
MNPLFSLISIICTMIFWIILVSVILSWLVAFQAVNLRNPVVARLYAGLNSLTERLYAPIRKIIPTVYGGMDISPMIVLLALWFIQETLRWLSVTYGL